MVEPEVWRVEGHVPEVSALVLDTGADTRVKWLCSSVGCISMVLASCGRNWNGLGREQGSLECVQKYWSQWELGLLEGWLVGVGIGVVFLVPPCLYLHIIPMHCRQSGRYVEMWTSFSVTSC